MMHSHVRGIIMSLYCRKYTYKLNPRFGGNTEAIPEAVNYTNRGRRAYPRIAEKPGV